MKYNIVPFLVIVLTGVVSYAGKLPPDYPTCKRDDPDFSRCLKNAVQTALSKLSNGIPSLHVPPLDPLHIPSITIGEGGGAVNVIQRYNNFNLYGLVAAKIEKLNGKITENDLTTEIELFTPEVKFEAEYTLNGRILLLPIQGNGKCTVKLQKLKTLFNMYAEAYEKKGKKYLQVKDITLKLIPGKVAYNFENLFNGDERLGAEMNRLLNDNWKEVYDDVGEKYQAALRKVFIDYVNRVHSQVPYDDLF